jgi:4'-phosphopantetheinyl transferase EntD
VPDALASILPLGAVAVERHAPAAEPPPLFPCEEALVADAVEGRRREFAEGRACARDALRRLGAPAGAIPADSRGAPRWPAGVVGSITHKLSYRAAAVARTEHLAGLGIDAEPDERLPTGVLATIASPRELDEIEALLTERPGLAWDRLLFSAKETAVKAAHPLELDVAGPRAVEVHLDGTGAAYTAVVAASPHSEAGLVVEGAWVSTSGMLVSVASVPRGASAAS